MGASQGLEGFRDVTSVVLADAAQPSATWSHVWGMGSGRIIMVPGVWYYCSGV